jgi:hypothetical protein
MTLSSGTWKATTTGTITTGGGSGQTGTPGVPGTIGNSG